LKTSSISEAGPSLRRRSVGVGLPLSASAAEPSSDARGRLQLGPAPSDGVWPGGGGACEGAESWDRCERASAFSPPLKVVLSLSCVGFFTRWFLRCREGSG